MTSIAGLAGAAPPDPRSPWRLSSAMGHGGPLALAAHRATFPAPPVPAGRADLRIVEAVERSGLRGRGGAGFPTGTKMRAVATRPGPAVVVANGSEGEPASRKDKTLLIQAPHLVLDGLLLAAGAVGASEAVIAVERGTRALPAVRAALAERVAEAGVAVRVVEVPRHYVAGEETALVHLVNGGDARPTRTPPRPFERGVRGRPTMVGNVETFAHLAMILRWGAAWFRALGTDDEPGTALVTVTGAVARPGVLEVPLGTPLARVVEAAGGPTTGVQAVLLGGYYGTWIGREQARSAALADSHLRPLGASVGCGAVVVLGDDACGLTETANVLTWMAGETAGQCGPCVHGLAAVAGAMEDVAAGRAGFAMLQRLHRWAGQIEGRGACRFPDGAVRLLRSALAVFERDLADHVRRTPCPGAGGPAQLPIPVRGDAWR